MKKKKETKHLGCFDIDKDVNNRFVRCCIMKKNPKPFDFTVSFCFLPKNIAKEGAFIGYNADMWKIVNVEEIGEKFLHRERP